MNAHRPHRISTGTTLVGLTLAAALATAGFGCSSSNGNSPGTGGSGGSTAGTGGHGGSTGTGGATAGTGGSTTGTGGTGTGGTGTGGTGTGGTATGGATAGTGGTAAGTGGATAGTGGSTAGTVGTGTGGTGTGGTGGTGTGGTGGPPMGLPPTLNVPSGATVKLHLHAIGDQVYTCTASAAAGTGGSGAGGAGGAGGSGTTYSFVLKQPDAKLYDQSNTQVGTHGAGPNWTSTDDASVVNGAKVFQENAPVTGAIPWLLLRATSNTGTGVFSDVTYVQRVNTSGGVAPATGCDATTAGMDTRVSYMADYYFYVGGGPGTAWLTPPGSLPTAIAVPSGTTLKLHDHAIGVQVYTCTASAAAAGAGGGGAGGAGGSGAMTYSYVLKQPDAVLYDQSFAQVGTHGLGPNWTSTADASVVNGAKVAGVNSTMTGAVQWLLLQASSNTGSGVFSDVTYVQRLNTAGGVAPATGCDATTAGTDVRIPYSADYYFFTGGGTTDGGTNG